MVKQVQLSKTGLVVSEVGFGGIPIQRLSDDEATRVIRRCLDLGVTLLDTAHGYSNSEERIGRAIQGRREGLVIATKSPARDAQRFREDMALSFRRLQVDHIDIFQFHNVSTEEAFAQVMLPGGPMDIAREAKAAGRIGHIGVTSHNLDMAITLVKSGHFETLMFPFNYITREPADALIPLCREMGVAFFAMKPMGGGLLDDASLSFKYLRRIEGVLPVVGIETSAEMEEIVSIVQGDMTWTAQDQAAVEALREELGTRFCRACDYCQPCPQGIAISMVMRLKSNLKRFPLERFYGEGTQQMVAVAATCADCGTCESRCPYDLSIRDVLRENVAWYEEMSTAYRSR